MQDNSLPYFGLFFILLFLFIIERYSNKNKLKTRQRLRLCSFFIFALFFSFRGYIGSDWFNYKMSYDITSWDKWLLSDYEFGFSALVKTLKLIGLDYFYTVAVITVLQLYLFDKFINRHFTSIVLPYVFLFALFPIVIIDLQRNFLSILIVMNGIHFLQNGNRKRFYIYVLMGCLFHLSAIVFFILPFFNKYKFGKIILPTLFFLGFIVYIFQINFYKEVLFSVGQLLGGRLEHLITQASGEQEKAYGISFGIIEKVFLSVLVIKNYHRLSGKHLLFLNLCVIYLLIYFYFSTSQSFINRFASLFMFGYIWYYVYLFDFYKKQKGFGMIAFFIISFLGLRIYAGYSQDIYRYKNTLFEKEVYLERRNIRQSHYDK